MTKSGPRTLAVGPGDLSPELRERIFSKLMIDPGACTLWMGSVQGRGYGVISVGGRQQLVHRLIYEIFEGSIPEGLQIDHVKVRGCNHRNCANVAHLEPVTPRENTMRGTSVAVTNAQKTHCPQGHLYDEKNTRQKANGRNCRICERDFQRGRDPVYLQARDAIMLIAQSHNSFTVLDARGHTGIKNLGGVFSGLQTDGLIERTGELGKSAEGRPVKFWRATSLGLTYRPSGVTE